MTLLPQSWSGCGRLGQEADGSYAADELMGRLVLVPCSQEARGLDAGPRLVERLMSLPDHRSAAIVDRISQEELAHVSVGTPPPPAGPRFTSTYRQHLCPILHRPRGACDCRQLLVPAAVLGAGAGLG